MYINASPPPPLGPQGEFLIWVQTEPWICFQNCRIRFVEYLSYPEMTGYHIFDNLLVKYSEQNYYLFKLLHIEPNYNVKFCFVLKDFFPVDDSVS